MASDHDNNVISLTEFLSTKKRKMTGFCKLRFEICMEYEYGSKKFDAFSEKYFRFQIPLASSGRDLGRFVQL